MAENTKSPVFSSPSYWVALGAGVVGIAAAAMQERKGSAAYGSITPPADAVFYATTRGGKWQFVVTPAGEHKGEAFYDLKDYKNGSLRGSGYNNLAGLRDRIPNLLHYSAAWDGIHYEVKIDTLGLAKGGKGSASRTGDDRAYREAFNQAVDMANRFQRDVGLRRNALGGYSVYLFTEAERYSHRGQVVRPGEPKMPISGSRARGGNFGGMDEAEWHDDFFARYGRETLTRLNRIAHEAELHYRPKDDPGYWGGMGTYRSMYDRILSGAKRYGIDERAAKAYASARGFYPEPTSKRRY